MEQIENPTSQTWVHGWDNSSSSNQGVASDLRRVNRRSERVARNATSSKGSLKQRAVRGTRDSAIKLWSGEAGIRTLGRVTPTLVFKTSALNHSATSPSHLPAPYQGTTQTDEGTSVWITSPEYVVAVVSRHSRQPGPLQRLPVGQRDSSDKPRPYNRKRGPR